VRHQLLSERRFFGEFFGLPELPPNEILPAESPPRCLRVLYERAPATYGPTADVTWQGADPTLATKAAGRGSGVK
jgi:hypothetical protein